MSDDMKTALRIIRELGFVPLGHDMTPAAEVVAAALAAEREKARAPFLALADEWAQADSLIRGGVYRTVADRIRFAAREDDRIRKAAEQ